MLVWTMKLPTSTAPSSDRPERANDAAHSSTNSSSGTMTTVGFHGLTSAPRPASEYVVLPGPVATSSTPSTPTQTDAQSARAGPARRCTTATHPTAARALTRVAPTKRDRAPEPSTR